MKRAHDDAFERRVVKGRIVAIEPSTTLPPYEAARHPIEVLSGTLEYL
jgi:hypothetical protein